MYYNCFANASIRIQMLIINFQHLLLKKKSQQFFSLFITISYNGK